jgi:carbamoyl-phosphate synthase small subunit
MRFAMLKTKDPRGALLLDDGAVFYGFLAGDGAAVATGELCFQTAMTGYQEVMTDPSYAGQIIVFTFPHIGNVGHNTQDWEAETMHAVAMIARERPTPPSNYRSEGDIDAWLSGLGRPLLYGIDTRALATHIRTRGSAPSGIIGALHEGQTLETLALRLQAFQGIEGADLASDLSTPNAYHWQDGLWGEDPAPLNRHIVVVDFGTKEAILRHLNQRGCRVTVVPASASFSDIMAHHPQGILLSNGPGDPAATLDNIQGLMSDLLAQDLPVFGICLGYQMLALALGATSSKMVVGHHGANHPVYDVLSKKVIITSQNHGFMIEKNTLPDALQATHISLFDKTLQGFRVKNRPIAGVQFHPECSPGPHDGCVLFDAWLSGV